MNEKKKISKVQAIEEVCNDIFTHMRLGKSPSQAFDAVFGEDAYKQLASDLYDAINANNAKTK